MLFRRSLVFAAMVSVAVAGPLKLNYGVGRTIGPWVTDGTHDPKDDYAIGTQSWRAWIDPDPPKYIAQLDLGAFATMRAAFPELGAGLVGDSWKFAIMLNGLSDDSLIVHTYEAVATRVEPEPALQFPANSVGAIFQVDYEPHERPGPDDPTDIHWIQTLVEQDGSKSVDNGGANNPFYDTRGAVSNCDAKKPNVSCFLDAPYATPDSVPHKWVFDLYIATQDVIQTEIKDSFGAALGIRRDHQVYIWGGVRWGWENACIANCTPTPESSTLLSAGLGFVLIAVWRLRR